VKTILNLLLLCVSVSARAAVESTPAPGNVGNAEYPRISSDLRVTFRLRAPNAKQVKLEGGTGLVKEPLEMIRGEDGAWMVTTPRVFPVFITIGSPWTACA